MSVYPGFPPYLPSHVEEDDAPETDKSGATIPVPVEMPDGTCGHICIKCNKYYPYVECKNMTGYICYDCKFWTRKEKKKE